MLEDGSLLFEKVARPKAGYVSDPLNKHRLLPTHPPCSKRITQPKLTRNGKTVIVNQCNHPDHPIRGQDVTAEDCKACPLRTLHNPIDGTLERP